MTTLYKCDFCDKTFYNSKECRNHESDHFDGVEKLKYTLLNNHEIDICDYCDNSYYVYGCELDCKFRTECNHRNNYKKFVPVNSIHNKRKNGGI